MSRFVIVVEWVVSHILIDSLFESETLTPSPLGGREFLRDFGSLFFLLALFLQFVFGIFKESLPSEWKSVFTQLIGVHVR